MGTNNLTTRSPGNVIRSADHNSFTQALEGDIVPRNGSGAPEDIAGDIGTSTYRFDNGYIKKVFIGEIAKLINFEGSGNDLIVKVGGTTVGKWTTVGLDGSYLVDESVDRFALAPGNVLYSAASGTVSHNSTSYQTVVEVDKGTYSNRYYMIGLTANSTAGTSTLKIEQATASHILGYVRILLDNATTIYETTLESASSAGASTRTLSVPPTSVYIMWDCTTTGNSNFKIQTRSDNTFVCTITAINVKAFITEMGGY